MEVRTMDKVEIFKRYLNNLIEKGEYEKLGEFEKFVRKYFQRKGQKTEYIYVVNFLVTSINEITDEMLDSIA